jgi:hypothetical protein
METAYIFCNGCAGEQQHVKTRFLGAQIQGEQNNLLLILDQHIPHHVHFLTFHL